MTPRDFLKEETESVAVALNSTLRHDYGPERSETYFEECKARLGVVKRSLVDNPQMDRELISTNMRRLSSLGSRISFIERAHLGEFSWPFALIIEKVAKPLFEETSLDDDMNTVKLAPIVHVIAEGTDYQIVDDEMPLPGPRRIIIVAFPRQLKHHVLLHAIFGHELAHTAFRAEGPGRLMETRVLPKAHRGPLQDHVQARAWLRRADAPAIIRARASTDEAFTLDDQSLINWRQEIICDLFGLRLFGPAFAAAHRTIIEALSSDEELFDPRETTHPPYAFRQRILASAIRLLNWDHPVTNPKHGGAHKGELELIRYVTEASTDTWHALFSDAELRELIDAIEDVLAPHALAYVPPSAALLQELVCRIAQERPPICQRVSPTGEPENRDVEGTHCLYSGWIYWFGREALAADATVSDPDVLPLSFLELNRLCDQALLQQRAIHLMNHPDPDPPAP